MGAINFSGGSWTGGGYGKLFEEEFFETDNGTCATCGEQESDCVCGQFDPVDHEYSRELFNKYQNNISDIENKVIKYIEKNKLKVKVRRRPRLISSLLKGIKENEGVFLTIETGYYDGFQIYANKSRLEGYYNDSGCINDLDVIQRIFEAVNDALNKIEWDYGL
jgi:hypothetical protein